MASEDTPAPGDSASTPPDATPSTPPSPTPPTPVDAAAEAALRAVQAAVDSVNSQAVDTPPEPEATSDADAEALAMAALAAAGRGPGVISGGAADAATSPLNLPSLGPGLEPQAARAIELLSDVNLHVKIELGRTRMYVEDVLRLAEGAVVELDKLAGDPVDIYVNDRHIARGEVLVLNDNFCVRVNEIIKASAEKEERSKAG